MQNISKQIIRLTHSHSKTLFIPNIKSNIKPSQCTVSTCQLSGERIIRQVQADQVSSQFLKTFYKPSPDIVDSHYIRHVYNKKTYIYAVIELYQR